MGVENPVFRSCVLFVKNIENSKNFYTEILSQKIVEDSGKYVGFEGGLFIWERDYALNLIFNEKAQNIRIGTNSVEVYFECENLDDLFNRLKGKIKIIHSMREQPWGQHVFRIYDPDNHIIEFAESMASVVIRLHLKGLSQEEISKKSMMPIEFIRTTLEK